MRFLFILVSLISASAFSSNILLKDFNFKVPDISEMNLTKEELFEKIKKNRVKVNHSICSNRAQVWAYDLKKQGVDSSKIFMFFTKKTESFERNSWWYHVSPAVNVKGTLWTLDAGFPSRIKKPLTVVEWLKEFNGLHSVCRQINGSDIKLLERIYKSKSFPEQTSDGHYNCYFIVVPGTFWVPSHVAMNLLGYDEDHRPVRLERIDFNLREVYEACREATTNPFGWIGGQNTNYCKKFVENEN